MGKYDEAYEQTMAKVLAEYIEQGVPEVDDAWPSIRTKLEKRQTSSTTMQPENRPKWFRSSQEFLLGHKPSVLSPNVQARSSSNFVRAAVGAIGMVTIVSLMVIAIASLARNHEFELARLPASNGQAAGDHTLLFTIQDDNSTIRSFYSSGFGIGDDGSFWIGRGDGRVVHYSQSGRLMATLDLSGTIKYGSDLEVQRSTLWVTSGPYVDKFNLDGSPIATYLPSLSVPGGQNTIIDYKLRAGGDGQMLVEQGNGTYLKVTNQTIGTDGKPEPPPLPGYPVGGKFYAQGSTPDEIMAGDVRVTIDVTATTGFTESEPLVWHILNVLKDGSFYVEVEPRTPDLGSPSPFIFVLHYAADGKLIERARASSPDWFMVDENEIAMGPDGSFYAEGLSIVPGNGQSLFGRLDVVRLSFYPAFEPLPALPPPIPTPVVPTPIPTVQGTVVAPPAIPTGTK